MVSVSIYSSGMYYKFQNIYLNSSHLPLREVEQVLRDMYGFTQS